MALKSSNVTARAGEGIPADEFFDSLKQEVSDDVLEAVAGGTESMKETTIKPHVTEL